MGTRPLLAALLSVALSFAAHAQELIQPPPVAPTITFNKNFEGASLGKVEVIDATTFRCNVEGQQDARGHNRQTSWYYFRVDHAKGRAITLTLCDFVGEYNDKPGAVAMAAGILPVYSADQKTWTQFDASAAAWDDAKKELTLTFTPEADAVYVAHVAPYTTADLGRLLAGVKASPYARVEVIGKSLQGRELSLVTVTDESVADAGKRVIWIQARQHAWEAGTSWVTEGALRFATSDDPAARELRKTTILKCTPMVDPDGCANGRVRFNGNGFDVNRHWNAVDLRSKDYLERMPEIWYAKKAILSAGRIDLMVNLHNTETSEYLETFANEEAALKPMRKLYDLLVERSTFDPVRKVETRTLPPDTTNSLWTDHKVPVMLMEQRISAGKKLGRCPTVADRLEFGKQLVLAMADAVRAE
jgi:hypothetical protein